MMPQLPDHPRIVSLSTGGQSNPAAVVIHHKPLYWKLQEHHCLHPDEPLLPGIDDMDGDDFLNAWLPQGITVTHLEVGSIFHLRIRGADLRHPGCDRSPGSQDFANLSIRNIHSRKHGSIFEVGVREASNALDLRFSR
jgi:hypothetical protein